MSRLESREQRYIKAIKNKTTTIRERGKKGDTDRKRVGKERWMERVNNRGGKKQKEQGGREEERRRKRGGWEGESKGRG